MGTIEAYPIFLGFQKKKKNRDPNWTVWDINGSPLSRATF